MTEDVILKLAFHDTRTEVVSDILTRVEILEHWRAEFPNSAEKVTTLFLQGTELVHSIRKIDGEPFGEIDLRIVAKIYHVFIHSYEQLWCDYLEIPLTQVTTGAA